MNITNRQSRRQLNKIENPHQFVAASSHVTDCDCEINNHFMNFLPIKLIMNSLNVNLVNFLKNQQIFDLPLQIYNIFESLSVVFRELDCELQFVQFPDKKTTSKTKQFVLITKNSLF